MSLLQVTIACPVTHLDDARELSRCIGLTEADGQTFDLAPHYEINGVTYAIASGLVEPSFLTTAQSPLVEPEWGADMEAAQRAQARVVIWDKGWQYDPDNIIAVVGMDPEMARSVIGAI